MPVKEGRRPHPFRRYVPAFGVEVRHTDAKALKQSAHAVPLESSYSSAGIGKGSVSGCFGLPTNENNRNTTLPMVMQVEQPPLCLSSRSREQYAEDDTSYYCGTENDDGKNSQPRNEPLLALCLLLIVLYLARNARLATLELSLDTI